MFAGSGNDGHESLVVFVISCPYLIEKGGEFFNCLEFGTSVKVQCEVVPVLAVAMLVGGDTCSCAGHSASVMHL